MKAITIEFEKSLRFPCGQAWFDGDDLLFCDEAFRRAFHIPPSVRRVSMRVSLRRFKGGRMVRVQNRTDRCWPNGYYCYTLRPDITPKGELTCGAVRWIEKNIRQLSPDGPVLTLWVSVTAKEKGA